jgi:hypothetical protein
MAWDLQSEQREALAKIYAAFDGVTREGGVSWSETCVIDDYGTMEERLRGGRAIRNGVGKSSLMIRLGALGAASVFLIRSAFDTTCRSCWCGALAITTKRLSFTSGLTAITHGSKRVF